MRFPKIVTIRERKSFTEKIFKILLYWIYAIDGNSCNFFTKCVSWNISSIS